MTATKKCDNCIEPIVQREKVSIGKHIHFSVEKKIKSILIAVKGWHKDDVSLSFQTSILNKCHERAEKCADGVSRRLLSSIDLVVNDARYQGLCESIFLRKNVYLQQRGPELNIPLHTPRITQ